MLKEESDPYLTPYSKLNSKWINDISVGMKTMKLLEAENVGKFS